MADVPTTARCVVIGAGIVGNSLVHHLAELGWRDIVQIDKGPLPNPGGSTGHASNFIFLDRPLAGDHRPDARLGRAVPGDGRLHRSPAASRWPAPRSGWRSCAAGCPRRRPGASRPSWSAPSSSQEKVPFLDKDQIIGAFWQPGVGVVDSLRAGTIMRERALEKGVLTVVPNVEVTDLEVEDGRITQGRTTGGDIEAETVVIACGVWSPKIADMAGVQHPADPGRAPDDQRRPVPAAGRDARARSPSRSSATWTRSATSASTAPTWRSAPTRTARSCMEPEDIPSIEQSKLSPTEMPFTSDDFDPQLEQAYELMPELLGAEGAEMRYAINGLLSLTCDGAADPRREPR